MSLPWCTCGHALSLHRNGACPVCKCTASSRVANNEELASLNSRATHRLRLKLVQRIRELERELAEAKELPLPETHVLLAKHNAKLQAKLDDALTVLESIATGGPWETPWTWAAKLAVKRLS